MQYHHLFLLAVLLFIAECGTRKGKKLIVKTKGNKGERTYIVNLKNIIDGKKNNDRKFKRNERKFGKNDRKVRKNDRKTRKNDRKAKKNDRKVKEFERQAKSDARSISVARRPRVMNEMDFGNMRSSFSSRSGPSSHHHRPEGWIAGWCLDAYGSDYDGKKQSLSTKHLVPL